MENEIEKRGIINTLPTTGGNAIFDDTTAEQWGFCIDGTDNTATAPQLIFEPIQYGSVVDTEVLQSQAEVRQLAILGASTTKETIVASQRYKIEIDSFNRDYESGKRTVAIHSYTAAATLSGTAATDRANVYTALIAKINAYAGNYSTAYAIMYQPFTLGTSTGDADTDFIVGETVTQETSGVTAKVAKSTITSGTMAGDDAAGHLWLYDISDVDSLDAGTKTWSGAGTVAGVSTNIVVTGTAASIVTDTGIAILDDAGYYTSSITRGGINRVLLTDGFEVDTVEIARAGVYSRGIGSDMLARIAVFNRDKTDLVSGDLNYFFNGTPDATETYTQYITTVKGIIANNDGVRSEFYKKYILFVSEAESTDLGQFDTAYDTVVAK